MKFNKICTIILSIVLVSCMTLSFVACVTPAEVKVDGVELSRANLSLDVGAQATLEAIIMPLGTEVNVTWKSSNNQVATVENGVVKGVSEGTALIRATAGGKRADCFVTVSDPAHATIKIGRLTFDASTLSLEVGSSKTITVTIEPSNATERTLVWSSSNQQVATVNNGVVTGVKKGSAIITATSNNNVRANCVVTVTDDNSNETDEAKLFVKKVNSLDGRTDFIMGMDASAVPSLEAAGVTYKNFEGKTEDVFKILKDNGITDIRIRVWNDPYQEGHSGEAAYSYGGGNCDISNAIAISNRCKAVGLGVIIDFHYSDFWADPGKQKAPKAWSELDESQKAVKIYEFTKESLVAIKATGVKITMVQVGNETTRAICGANYGTDAYCNFIASGSRAVREVTGSVEQGGAKVAIHLTNPESRDYVGYAKTLADANVDYDVFGSSYYPFWHGTLANLGQKLAAVNKEYGKEVMVLETSYAFSLEDFDGAGNTLLSVFTEPTTVQGQSNAVRNVIETVADLGDYGLGVCYWEGTWIAPSESNVKADNIALCSQYGCGWASARAADYDVSASTEGGVVIDNQAFFRSNGMPLQSLKVFKLAAAGQNADPIADKLDNQEGYYTVNEGSIELPKTVNIVLNDGSSLKVDAIWKASNSEVAKYINTVGEYIIEGTTMYGGTCYFTAYVQNKNLLINGGFEEDQGYGSIDNKIEVNSPWAYEIISKKHVLQLYVSEKADDAKMGVNSMHFWDDSAVEFKLYQQVDLAKAKSEYGNGTYNFSIDVMGGDAGEDHEVYAYAVVTYNDGTEALMIKGTVTALTKWQVWTRTAVDGIELTDNVESITVGVYVKGEAGVWGNIDNAQFFFSATEEK